MRHVKMLFIFIVFVFCASAALVACEGDIDQPAGPVTSGGELDVPELAVQNHMLGGTFCTNYPAICNALCNAFPVWCDHVCNSHPNLPFCDDEPMCVELGDPCVDEEDPGFVPCCGEEDGTAGCFLDQETGLRACRVIDNSCEGPGPNDECLPEMEGQPCCPESNGDPYTCEATDPSDPNTSYICTPAP